MSDKPTQEQINLIFTLEQKLYYKKIGGFTNSTQMEAADYIKTLRERIKTKELKGKIPLDNQVRLV